MNTLRYAKKLEEIGFSREQAEVTIGILSDVVEGNLATKVDVKDLRQEMKDLAAELRQEMKTLEFKMQQMESRIVIRLGGMMLAGFAIMTAAIPMIINLM